jgi:hypothetical protein
MPWNNVGGCSSGQMPGDRDWIVFCYEMAISYLDFVLGDPPHGCKLGVMWHEYELGEYPSISICWEHPQSAPAREYIQKCEVALSKFDQAIAWFDISPRQIENEIESSLDDSDWHDGGEEI